MGTHIGANELTGIRLLIIFHLRHTSHRPEGSNAPVESGDDAKVGIFTFPTLIATLVCKQSAPKKTSEEVNLPSFRTQNIENHDSSA